MIYLDNAATTKPKESVIKAINQCLTETWGNPSSLHSLGTLAKKVVDSNRQIVANFIGAKASEIIFTSGACESNSMALCGYLEKYNAELITTSIEHKSIINIAKEYVDKATILDVDSNGFIDLRQLEDILRSSKNKKIVSIQYANNEIGTIQDISNISKLIHKYDGVFHTDATQILADRKINVAGIDMLSFSGQKIGATKGIGVLFVRQGIKLKPIIYGSQENGLRGGTENVPYIAGLGAAIKDIEYPIEDIKDFFVDRILSEIPNTYLIGSQQRLKNNASICFKGINAELLLLMLNDKGIYASSGSACNHEPSHVLKAIGLSDNDISSTIRFTFGIHTQQDINQAVDDIIKIVKVLSKFNKTE